MADGAVRITAVVRDSFQKKRLATVNDQRFVACRRIGNLEAERPEVCD
jgi:hypothetical protein